MVERVSKMMIEAIFVFAATRKIRNESVLDGKTKINNDTVNN